MTTTTANAVKVMQHLEFCRQVLWPALDVQITSVSEQWAQMAIAGPRSRDLLRAVIDDEHDISDAAFPYLAARTVSVGGGIEARLFRVSFSGELAYELAVAGGYGDALARALMAAGRPFGVTPYGLEAMGVMRIEKGHVAGGELNGQTTARDLGLGAHDVAEEGFHRPRDGRPSGFGRPGQARFSSASSRSIPSRGCGPARISWASASRRIWKTMRAT